MHSNQAYNQTPAGKRELEADDYDAPDVEYVEVTVCFVLLFGWLISGVTSLVCWLVDVLFVSQLLDAPRSDFH